MAKIQPVWSLDVGQAALKALKLVPGEDPDAVMAEAFDYVEYPKILSQPDADPDQLVREALETFLERNELKGCKVAISVPGQAGLVKFIKLPPVEKKRIPDIVKFEAKQQIPFALEEVIWAYQQIGDDEEEGDDDFTMAEVGLFAMKRDQINRAILPFRVAGIEVDIVQMGPIALYNYITYDQIKAPKKKAKPEGAEGEEVAGESAEKKEEPAEEPEEEAGPKGSIVLIDIGADNTDLIITDGTRIWQRNVPIGGNHFTRALTKELKLTFAKAEHLKRNATKAPDPRSIFTAMRGVFNDFAGEINRSIGFYSSVNRNAKILKVVGLGNGFKLPGLQKFLQQNLSHEVEKLEGFGRMVGEDVKTAPQFQENLPSFAVAYGLGVQGLGRSGLRTNLLPPEIEQVRLIRAKKPWALAASALLMLGFSALFLGDYNVLAKVDNEPFHQAVDRAKSVATTGAGYKTAYDAAKGEWTSKFNEGKSLIIDTAGRGKWAAFLKTLNSALPDPVREFKLDPNKPKDQPKLDRLRVHIDGIKPVLRKDVKAEWFDNLPEPAKNLMHPYDRANAPTGEGWIIQLIGHHYNPLPSPTASPDDRRTMFGPYPYLTQKIIPSLITPSLRLYGVKGVTLRWLSIDRQWTNEKGAATNGLTNTQVPILARAEPPAAEGASGGGPMSDMMKSMMSAGLAGASGGLAASGGIDPSMMARMMAGMSGGMGVMPNAASKKNLTTLTRTDFLIQFVWQPPKPEEMPKTPEDLKKQHDEIVTKLTEAEKNKSAITMVREADLEEISKKQSQDLTNALTKQATAAPGTPPGTPAPGAPGVPPVAPAATPPGTPAATPPGAPK